MHHRMFIFALGLAAIITYLLGSFTLLSTAESPSSYTPEAYMTIGVRMYELDQYGGYAASTPTPCSYGNTKWGCTAFCDNDMAVCQPGGLVVTPRPYPYLSSQPTVPVENDYIVDVVPQEMSASSPLAALEAQAIAARSFAQYYNENPPIPPTQQLYNNSGSSYQVFVPYKFDSLNPLTILNNPGDPCNSTNLNSYQQSVCNAVSHKVYISYFASDAPAKASFSKDFLGYSVDQLSDKPYFVGVGDPISTACGAQWLGNPWGMSQQGAIRWAKGNQCAGGSSMPWSVQWRHPEQILFHYFTYVHLRDASNSNSILSPEYRWNPLSLSMIGQCPTIMHKNQSCTFTFLVQNTGTTPWLDGQPIYLWFHGWESGTMVMRQETQTLQTTVLPGQTILQSISLTPPAHLRSGRSYTLRFEMGLEIPPEYIWQGFSNLEPGYPWFTYNIPVCIDDCRIYLPMVIK